MGRFVTLVVFILVVIGVGSLIGATFAPDDWYQGLQKPFYTPPGLVFGIVWPVLYFLIAVAGGRVFLSEGQTPGWGFWVGQMILNFAWSPVFFGAHQLFWGMWIIVGTLVFSCAFYAAVWERDRLAAFCFVPYIAWLFYALLLNVSLWIIN